MSNNLPDKIRNHWLWLAVTVICAFIGATWTVSYELRVAPLEDEITHLSERIAELQNDKSAQESHKSSTSKLSSQEQTTQPHKSTNTEVITQDQTTQTKEKHQKDWLVKGGLFNKGSPYPKNYDEVKIGTKISVMKNIYPSATYTSATQTWYVDLTDGPFGLLRFAVSPSSDSNDPKITAVMFYFRNQPESIAVDQAARQYVINQAYKYFGTKTVISKMLGKEMEWPSVRRVRVEIGTYRLTLSKSNIR